jgi:hypothetical protein
MTDQSGKGKTSARNSGAPTGVPAGGIYKEHDSALQGYAKAVATEYLQDVQQNESSAFNWGQVGRQPGKSQERAHEGINFGTDTAQDSGKVTIP